MNREELIIRWYSYLRSPYFTWSVRYPHGGSFSNSGQHRSRRSAIRHFLIQSGGLPRWFGMPVKVFKVDANGAETVHATLSIGVHS